HLLQHSSGIPNVTEDSTYLSWNTKPITKEAMIAKIAERGSDFTPGTKAEYSNSNYILLTHIVCTLFKKPFDELIKEHITNPLNLKRTFVGKKINQRNNESFSYEFDKEWKISSETDMSVPQGAGNIISTPSDLTQFMHGLMQGKLVSEASLKQMVKLEKGFGLGLFPIPFYDKKGYGHTGGIDGFRSVACYFPSDSITYALTSNGSNIETNNISVAVLSILYNRPFTIPSFTKVLVPDSLLHAYTGKYVSKTLPIQLIISYNNGEFRGQVIGQSSFPLKAINTQKFSFEQAGVVIEFNLANKELTLQQAGQKLLFQKE
ncbi:MAG: serine hydrolase domain-containing protein, partial [Chitinophagaceae bacterium]